MSNIHPSSLIRPRTIVIAVQGSMVGEASHSEAVRFAGNRANGMELDNGLNKQLVCDLATFSGTDMENVNTQEDAVPFNALFNILPANALVVRLSQSDNAA